MTTELVVGLNNCFGYLRCGAYDGSKRENLLTTDNVSVAESSVGTCCLMVIERTAMYCLLCYYDISSDHGQFAVTTNSAVDGVCLLPHCYSPGKAFICIVIPSATHAFVHLFSNTRCHRFLFLFFFLFFQLLNNKCT